MASPRHRGPTHSAVRVRADRRARVEPMTRGVTHTENVFTLLVGGWIRVEHGRPLRAEAGNVVLVPAGAPHRSLGGADVVAWSVAFCGSCVDLKASNPLMQPFARVRRGALPLVTLSRTAVQRFVRHCKALQHECNNPSPVSLELLRAHLCLLLGEVVRAMPAPGTVTKPRGSGSLVDRALSFIQAHALESISLAEVAAAVHRSPAHVTTEVRKATGHAVGTWIAAAKVAEVTRWLEHTDETLEEIAVRVGWKDKTHLIRQFRKIHGETPAAWRRRHRGQGHG